MTVTVSRLTLTPELREALDRAGLFRFGAFDQLHEDLHPWVEPAKTAYVEFCGASAAVARQVANQLEKDAVLIAPFGRYSAIANILFMSAPFPERLDTSGWTTPTMRRLIPGTVPWGWRTHACMHLLFLEDMAEVMS